MPGDKTRIFLIGPPACGKGTLAQNLAAFGIPHISSGQLIRDALENSNAVRGDGILNAEDIAKMRAGEMVPDSKVNALVLARLRKWDCADGFILDGYPRNVEQAQFLHEHGFGPTLVVWFNVDIATCAERALKRGRVDDSERNIRQRFVDFDKLTAPVGSNYLQMMRNNPEQMRFVFVGDDKEQNLRIVLDALSLSTAAKLEMMPVAARCRL